MYPKAIRDRFFAEDLGEETVVFNAASREARSLNATASYVWRQCDGRTSVEEIGSRVSDRFGVSEGSDIATLAVEELRQAGMLEIRSFDKALKTTVSRRALLGKLAAVGALVPLVSVAQQTQPPKKQKSFVPKRAQGGGNDF